MERGNPAGRVCQQCSGSLEGKRSDAKFCGVNCRNAHFKHQVGRVDAITAQELIGSAMRTALIEAEILNPQDEHDPDKLREAFSLMCRKFEKNYA
ncbi:hypothetical protein [Mesorhizobium sp. NZP2077]|uniref:hypothetical protein n=1 Tax=Mesorhizobium sp. NZP2077 TaxID=2483404 RepID=UPI00155196CB|nr:hypothetical protein [Mesorhizobium sp. NZP2077]QKC83945.1 hypothetical protein EB232_22205 [Mesorhizobium sp. NZP2077]QKD17482.1 hypothetical protein HGP13_21910 [Mesorhizobium sp. NZP2077]